MCQVIRHGLQGKECRSDLTNNDRALFPVADRNRLHDDILLPECGETKFHGQRQNLILQHDNRFGPVFIQLPAMTG